MIARRGAAAIAASIVGAAAGFVTRPCCIGPALVSMAGVSSAGLAVKIANYHTLFASLGAVMLTASMWMTFRREGGWFNKVLAASTTIIGFTWATGRMGVR